LAWLFGIAGIGSAVFGELADRTSIEYVLLGMLFSPSDWAADRLSS
jgi:hypothetical protein